MAAHAAPEKKPNPYCKNTSKKFDLKSLSNGVDIGSLKVDPLLVGVGLGWRF